MSSAYSFLLLALLSLSGLGVCHKLADFRHCKASAISVMLFGCAATILWSYTLFYKVAVQHVALFPPFTRGAVFVALVCGAGAGIAILSFQVGVRYGRISTSWLVINLSTIVPSLLSLIVYREWKMGFKWQQLAGLFLVLVSIVMLWRDKLEETREAGSKGSSPVPAERCGDEMAAMSISSQDHATEA
jgi:hypothetical protein